MRWIGLLVVCGCGTVDVDSLGTTADDVSGSSDGNEVASGWETCSNGPTTNCGGKGGAGSIVDTEFLSDVSGGGRSAVAQEHTAAGVAYGTSYWYRQTGAPTFLATSIDYSTDVYVPSSVGAQYQAIEWDGEQHLGGYTYNYAWQAERGSKQWRWYDKGGAGWQDSGITFAGFAPDTWHTLHAHYSVTGSTITNDWLEVDGVRAAPTVSTAHTRVAGSGTKMNIGLQLDQDSAGDAMTVYWDNVDLVYTNDVCGPPVVTAPTAGASTTGPTIALSTAAPSCIQTTKCYLSSGSTAVATGGNALAGVSISVPLGANSISCNGWDASGKSYVGAHVAFTRTN